MPDGLLLIHAWPTDSRIWQRQADELGGRVPVVAPDLPGFGGAEPAGDVMTMAAGAERCLAELDRAGMDRAVVCGLSMGGYVAFELWRRARDRIAGFVLANTRAVGDSEEGAANRRRLADRLRAEGIEFFLANPPPLLSEHAPDDLRARLRSIIADQPPASIGAALLGMAERPDSTPDLSGIDVPHARDHVGARRARAVRGLPRHGRPDPQGLLVDPRPGRAPDQPRGARRVHRAARQPPERLRAGLGRRAVARRGRGEGDDRLARGEDPARPP